MALQVPRTTEDIFVDIYDRIGALQRRIENKKRTGVIHEVNAKDGWARVKLGEDRDGKPFLTGKIKWKEVAMGAIKTHFPPKIGEQVEVVSESGDFTDAFIETSVPSKDFKRPHDKEAEAMIEIEDTTRIIMKKDLLRFESPKVEFQQVGNASKTGVVG